ncbi:hypothetical protein EO92_13510 [Methanosarcina sp. 2.H.A.1B.4]|nr:hypothetical protein EO92_13510 [Methanosarcina sp. 2.H.A.1B.4]
MGKREGFSFARSRREKQKIPVSDILSNTSRLIWKIPKISKKNKNNKKRKKERKIDWNDS